MIRSLGIQAATPEEIECVISATYEGLKPTGQTINTVVQALRNLVGTTFMVTEPTGPQSQWRAYCSSYKEQSVKGGGNEYGTGYVISLTLLRLAYQS
jgi:hypothetical protein